MNDSQVQHCESMADVRRHIDELDTRIVALLAERSGYVAQAARIKQDAAHVYDQGRIDFIVERVKGMAAKQGAPEAVMEATYRAMIDAFIAFERQEFARLREGEQA
jgi:isochorismate pyruvate lyase